MTLLFRIEIQIMAISKNPYEIRAFIEQATYNLNHYKKCKEELLRKHAGRARIEQANQAISAYENVLRELDGNLSQTNNSGEQGAATKRPIPFKTS